jgi:protein SCO1/2
MHRGEITTRGAQRAGPIGRIALAAALAIIQMTIAKAGPAVTIGGPFTLTAPDGSVVTDRTYQGKWLLVYFGYTFCPTTCPTTLMNITAVLDQFGPDVVGVQAIFITLDPRRDTPGVLRQYTASFDPRIVGLTGNPEQIAAVSKAYGAYAASHRTGPGPDDYVIDHSSYIYLMDPKGAFVRGFDAETPPERIVDALQGSIARSSKQGPSGSDAGATTH